MAFSSPNVLPGSLLRALLEKRKRAQSEPLQGTGRPSGSGVAAIENRIGRLLNPTGDTSRVVSTPGLDVPVLSRALGETQALAQRNLVDPVQRQIAGIQEKVGRQVDRIPGVTAIENRIGRFLNPTGDPSRTVSTPGLRVPILSRALGETQALAQRKLTDPIESRIVDIQKQAGREVAQLANRATQGVLGASRAAPIQGQITRALTGPPGVSSAERLQAAERFRSIPKLESAAKASEILKGGAETGAAAAKKGGAAAKGILELIAALL